MFFQGGSGPLAHPPPLDQCMQYFALKKVSSEKKLSILTPGGTLIFSTYAGSEPASTVHPKTNQEFQAPQKIFEILATQKNIPILYLDLKKRP